MGTPGLTIVHLGRGDNLEIVAGFTLLPRLANASQKPETEARTGMPRTPY